jgi:hypothetical protein
MSLSPKSSAYCNYNQHAPNDELQFEHFDGRDLRRRNKSERISKQRDKKSG